MQHPGFREAVLADAAITARLRFERGEFRSGADALCQVLRLMAVSDAFAALVAYRAKARLQGLGIPVLPRLAHRLAIALGQVAIGDPVRVEPGVYLMHGQVVIDGLTVVCRGAVIAPFVTIGLRSDSLRGPTIGAGATIGTGARVLGPVRVGAGATVGANAVVLADVEDGAVVVGAPARRVR